MKRDGGLCRHETGRFHLFGPQPIMRGDHELGNTVRRLSTRHDIGTTFQRPDLVANPNLDSGRTAQRWFNTGAFQMPDKYTFGNAGRNIVYEAGEASVDFSLLKNTAIRESARMEFRAEIFNLPNRTNFVGAPGRIFNTPNFGRLFNAGPSRQMQLALKLMF